MSKAFYLHELNRLIKSGHLSHAQSFARGYCKANRIYKGSMNHGN